MAIKCETKVIGTAQIDTINKNGKQLYCASDILEDIGMCATGGHKLGRHLSKMSEARKVRVQRTGKSRGGTTWMITADAAVKLIKELNPRDHKGKMRAERLKTRFEEVSKTDTDAKVVEPATLTPTVVAPNVTSFVFPYDNNGFSIIAGSTGVQYIPLHELCTALGLDLSAQLKRVTADSRFDWIEVRLPDAQNRNRKYVCLSLMSLHGWLYTISAKRVKPEIQAKLLVYQRELTAAIHDFCTKGYAGTVALTENEKDEKIALQAGQISALRTQLNIMTQHAKSNAEALKYIQTNMATDVPIPVMSTRSKIVRHVRGFATKILHQCGLFDDEAAKTKYYDDLWKWAYRTLKYVELPGPDGKPVHIDYYTRYNNMDPETRPDSVLALIEQDGKIEELYQLIKVKLPYNGAQNF